MKKGIVLNKVKQEHVKISSETVCYVSSENYAYDFFATTQTENYEDFEYHAELMQDADLRRLDGECKP